jgi:hypothetical protein
MYGKPNWITCWSGVFFYPKNCIYLFVLFNFVPQRCFLHRFVLYVDIFVLSTSSTHTIDDSLVLIRLDKAILSCDSSDSRYLIANRSVGTLPHAFISRALIYIYILEVEIRDWLWQESQTRILDECITFKVMTSHTKYLCVSTFLENNDITVLSIEDTI